MICFEFSKSCELHSQVSAHLIGFCEVSCEHYCLDDLNLLLSYYYSHGAESGHQDIAIQKQEKEGLR